MLGHLCFSFVIGVMYRARLRLRFWALLTLLMLTLPSKHVVVEAGLALCFQGPYGELILWALNA